MSILVKHANTPSKRLGVAFVALSAMILLFLISSWNINRTLFIYRDEIQPLSFSVPIKKALDNPESTHEADRSSGSGLFPENREYMNPSHATVYLDRLCFYTEAKGQLWQNLSEEKQGELIGNCSAHKFGQRYEWKTSFSEFLNALTKMPMFYIFLFFFLGGCSLIAGFPQRFFVWIQKGE